MNSTISAKNLKSADNQSDNQSDISKAIADIRKEVRYRGDGINCMMGIADNIGCAVSSAHRISRRIPADDGEQMSYDADRQSIVSMHVMEPTYVVDCSLSAISEEVA